jgi:hypothetical protein
MDFSQLMRAGGGAMGGMGQGMMDQNMRRTYESGRSGGFQDLMANKKIGDFVRTGGQQKAGDVFGSGQRTRGMVESIMQPPATGMRPPMGGR